MIIIHKEVYTRGLGQNAESEQERRFGGPNKSMDRDDLGAQREDRGLGLSCGGARHQRTRFGKQTMEERAIKWEVQPTGVRAEKGCSEEWELLCPGLKGREMTEDWERLLQATEWEWETGRSRVGIRAKRLSLLVGNCDFFLLL